MSWRIIIPRPSEGQKTDSDQTWQHWLLSRPQAKTREKSYVLKMTQWSSSGSQTETLQTRRLLALNLSSQSSHHVHSPQSPSSSPPAQFSPREHLVSPNPEDHTAPKQQTIIRPQDIDKQPTPRLAALIQETSPLAPYKIQRSAKRRARQMLSNMR